MDEDELGWGGPGLERRDLRSYRSRWRFRDRAGKRKWGGDTRTEEAQKNIIIRTVREVLFFDSIWVSFFFLFFFFLLLLAFCFFSSFTAVGTESRCR